MKNVYKLLLSLCVLGFTTANAQFTVIEDFESTAPFPWGAWTGTGSVDASDSYEGAQMFDTGSSWPYRDDVSYGVTGDTLSCWTKAGSGRTYWGFGASASGCYSFVAAPNTGDIRFQENPGYGYVELNTTAFTFTTGAWYRMEVIFITDTDVVGNLYDADGTTLLATVSQSLPGFTPGGFAFRTFSGNKVDYLTATNLCFPLSGSETLSACGSYTVPSGDETYTASGIYNDTIQNYAGCDSVLTLDVTITPMDDPSFSYSASDYCVDGSDPVATITGLSGGTFSSAAGLDLNPSDGAIDLDLSTAGTYDVKYVTAGTCPDSSTVSVTVNDLPTVVANVTDTEICLGDAVTFTGSGASTYLWTGGVTDGSAFTPASSGTVTYTVTGTSAAGCDNTDAIDVTVNDLPTVTAAASETEICLGESVTFTGSGADTYSWTGGVTDGDPFTPSTSGTDTYTVTGTNTTTGCENTDDVDVTVNDLPTVTAAASETEICLGESVTFTGSGADSYSWTGGVTDGDPFTPSTAGTDTYTVTGTNTTTGCENTDDVDVTVNDLPTVVASASETEICFGESVTFTGSGADTYSWSGGVTDGDPFTPASTGTVTYTVTGTNTTTGCENTDDVDVNVLDELLVIAAVDDSMVCVGMEVTFTGSGASTYVWTGGVTDGDPFVTTTPGTETYTVTGSTSAGCEGTDSVDLTVVDNDLAVTSTVTDESAGGDGAIDITVTGGTPTYIFDWDNDGTGDFDDTEDLTDLTGGTYVVVVQDSNGCQLIDSIDVEGTQAGLYEANGLTFKVYPNPVKNNLTIEFGDGEYNYTITNSLGAIVLEGKATETEVVDLSTFARGTYFLNVRVDNKWVETIRLIKR